MTPLSLATPREEPTRYSVFARSFTRPPGKLCLLYGNDAVFHLAHTVVAAVLRRGGRVAVADGGNWFNVHSIINVARATRYNPDDFLRRIFISRSFTCYQMEQTVTRLLPGFLKSIGSRAAFLFGLLDTLYDEQAQLREVQQILQRILASLRDLKSEGTSILITCLDRTVVPEERSRLLTTLGAAADQIYHLRPDEHQRLLLLREHRTSSAIAQPKGDHHGTDRTDLYQHHRQRAGKLEQVPPRPAPRRPGCIR